ncbi:MAG: Phage replication protein [Fibrobacterota bacterium]|jgi:hypothetical protein
MAKITNTNAVTVNTSVLDRASRITVDAHWPGSVYVHVPDRESDPFVDMVTATLQPVVAIDMAKLFSTSARLGSLRCGRGTISVRVAGDAIEVQGCPAKILRGSNAFPGMNNVRLVKSFLAEVAKALSAAAVSGPPLHMYVAAVARIDLTIMIDLGDPVLAWAVFAMLRMLLRCRFPVIEGEHARDFLYRVLYANTIQLGSYGEDFSVKVYCKSVEQAQDPECDPEIEVGADTCIRIEITSTSAYASKLLGHDKPLSLPELVKHAREIFDGITSGLVIMNRQCTPLKRVKSPVPEYPEAYEAWLVHGWTKQLHRGETGKVLRAFRDIGIDLVEPPVPERDRDRFAVALGVGVGDLLDLSRVRRVKPATPAAVPQGSQPGLGGLGPGSASSRRERLPAGPPEASVAAGSGV